MAAADMDIEMDIDMGLTDQDLAVPDIEVIPEQLPGQQIADVSAPNDATAPDALQPAPEKVHLRGLDNLTTKDIREFASEYFSESKPSNIEWIDDTSANLVYETPEMAREALVAFSAVEIADVAQIPLLQNITAKSFSLHPRTNLEVRLAVVGDRKQPGARERSRFYLFNPEYDPAERRKRAPPRGGNKYRDRDDGGYRSQRYDDREQWKRQNEDKEAGFDASLYDDDETTLAARRKKGRRDSSSSRSDPRGRRVRLKGAAGKELFPDRGDRGSNGRLRDRSASPVRDSDGDQIMEEERSRRRDMAASTNRQKAQLLKAQLRDTASSKELFPHKTINHRRSDAFDAADATADLFSRQMPVPFVDGSSDLPAKLGLPLASRISSKSDIDSGRLNIRGAAKASAVRDFAIKGSAADSGVKELFPSNGNSGKELFSDRLEGRGRRRQKAEDLFY